jgi:hypothetical protein
LLNLLKGDIMLLFTRLATLGGSPRKTMPWAVGITEYVNAHGTLPVTCWATTFGRPLGTVAWSSMAESQSALAGNMGSLVADSGYLDLIDAAAEFVTTPGEDILRELVYGTPGDPAQLGAVVNVTTATAIVDRMAEAVGWAVEIAQHVESVIGTPVGVFTDVFGTLGGIAWIGISADVAASDASRAKLNADSDYLKQISGSKGLFIDGSGHVSQATRIA